MIHSDDVERILLDITLGRPAPKNEAADFAALRAQLKKECDAIVAKGGTVDIPREIPDVA